MTTQELFENDRDLRKWWTETVTHPNWEKMKMLADSKAFSESGSTDFNQGMNKYRSLLDSFIAPLPPAKMSAGPSIKHDFDAKPPSP